MTRMQDHKGWLQCGDCESWIRLEKDIGVCKDPRSNHYEHLITKTHPACVCLETKLEEGGEG